MEELIAVRDARLGYGKTAVLSDVTLTVHRGDFMGIVGPNGSGKTTLLKTILGLTPPLAGSVTVGRSRHMVGYVPQRDALDSIYPLTVLDVVLMGLYDKLGPVGRPGRRERTLAEAALDDAGIAPLADRSFSGLSGGEKQRTIIARALAGSPELLVLDEPTNGMDLPGEEAILSLIRHLHDEHAITVLLVSHLLNSVINHAELIAIVGGGRVNTLTRAEITQTDRLSQLYGVGVHVATVLGRHVVVPGHATTESTS